ncbi:universal stress protein [Streptomyces sp. SID2999]|uniref:universal stress protein n=1 Tax=Streptomyces sp. SID2999 TaxID=2690258 RepID=UPI001369DFAD|nr:universal stress protein [Streptomyces sp. SID2999]MYZ09435.1 universal stress protein [Streptomyces sp. SID2999]
MPRTVTAGLDGSAESRAAVEWAAREAVLRGLPLRLVQVWEPLPDPLAQAPLLGAEAEQDWIERAPDESAEGLRLRHPGLEVSTERRTGDPVDVLCEAAGTSELLALGSRGLGGLHGFIVGSVGLAVTGHAGCPVVLVRAGEQAADEHRADPTGIPSAATPFRPVVLGLDITAPDAALLEFAFGAAALRGAPLRVVYAWVPQPPPSNETPGYAYEAEAPPVAELEPRNAFMLGRALEPWRESFPDVDVAEAAVEGSAGSVLVDASRDACLVVVGRRVRKARLGAHLGHVAHAVLHHSPAPVAVVPHA